MIALAIAEAYRQAFPNIELLFLGNAGGLEARLARQRGYLFCHVPSAPFQRQGLTGKARALAVTIAGVAVAGRYLRNHGVRLVIGVGSFASIGPLLAARGLKLGRVIHEANVVPGLANRLLGRVVERIFVGFEETTIRFPDQRSLVVGIPVRREILDAAFNRKTPPGSGRSRRLLVTAGSEGSAHLDRYLPTLARSIVQRGIALEVHHQVGLGDLAAVRRAYAEVGIRATVEPYFDDMVSQYAWADFAFAAAGAATLAELAVLGLPAVLVPVRSVAEDHQRGNVRALERTAGLWWADERNWRQGMLTDRVADLLGNDDAWSEASERMRRLAAPEAGQAVVDGCESLMTGRW